MVNKSILLKGKQLPLLPELTVEEKQVEPKAKPEPFTESQTRILIKSFRALLDTVSKQDVAEGFGISLEEIKELETAIDKYEGGKTWI